MFFIEMLQITFYKETLDPISFSVHLLNYLYQKYRVRVVYFIISLLRALTLPQPHPQLAEFLDFLFTQVTALEPLYER